MESQSSPISEDSHGSCKEVASSLRRSSSLPSSSRISSRVDSKEVWQKVVRRSKVPLASSSLSSGQKFTKPVSQKEFEEEEKIIKAGQAILRDRILKEDTHPSSHLHGKQARRKKRQLLLSKSLSDSEVGETSFLPDTGTSAPSAPLVFGSFAQASPDPASLTQH